MAGPLTDIRLEVNWDGACVACLGPFCEGQSLALATGEARGILVRVYFVHASCMS